MDIEGVENVYGHANAIYNRTAKAISFSYIDNEMEKGKIKQTIKETDVHKDVIVNVVGEDAVYIVLE
jgi:hypothetical protein